MNPDQLQHIYGCSSERAATFCEPLNAAMRRYDISTPARQAAFLAQVGHESGRLMYVQELADGHAYNGRADLGNTKPDAYQWAGSTLPGPYFKGHGLIQITGYDNHLAAGLALYPDDPQVFLRNPKALCEPGDAAMSAGWVWDSRNLNALADADDFREITIRINGGLNGQPDRLLLWDKAKHVLGEG